MSIRRKADDEYDEHGIHYAVPWDLFIVGSSVFVPTITPRKVGRWFRRQGDKRGMKIEFDVGVEKGVYGVRVYRKL